mgnify:CR=1 FL=1
MYKLLLSWRYLKSRYIALASIVSVTLGVATLIVVNSVMAGFSDEMHKRLHGILSDVVIRSHDLNGLPDPQWHMDEIQKLAGDQIEAMTAAIQIPAMINFRDNIQGQWITQPITLIGIDQQTYAGVSDFSEYLLHPDNRQQLDFLLKENDYGRGKKDRFPVSGWARRRVSAEWQTNAANALIVIVALFFVDESGYSANELAGAVFKNPTGSFTMLIVGVFFRVKNRLNVCIQRANPFGIIFIELPGHI